jgi:hypothetical protein
MSQEDPTADYRTYPKGPNFGLIVALFCVTIILIFLGAFVVLKINGRHLMPHKPNPQPNAALVRQGAGNRV